MTENTPAGPDLGQGQAVDPSLTVRPLPSPDADSLLGPVLAPANG